MSWLPMKTPLDFPSPFTSTLPFGYCSDPGGNRRAVPRPEEAIVAARACRVLAVEDHSILVESLVERFIRVGVGEITGNQQTPAAVVIE